MASSSSAEKRKTADTPVSPPPVKRRVQSGTTKTAVQSFFTPASQKPKERTTWSERGPNDDVPATLLVGRYEPENRQEGAIKRCKIAAFDLDSTLITTSSGKKHASGAADWQWWDRAVPERLRQLHQDDGYRVVILSNQAGLKLHVDANYKGPKALPQKRVGEFKQKCNAVLSQLDLPVSVYAATAKDIYRKPRTGMWKELCDDYDIPEGDLDLENSFFVGDAGGRVASLAKTSDGVAAAAKDFSCSDRNFAHNVGIAYKTPEEFFRGEEPRQYIREFDIASYPHTKELPATAAEVPFEKADGQDIVLFCGPPGSGKSTFYWDRLRPLGYKRVNQDILKSRDKCVKVATEFVKSGDSVVIDNTNADPDTRAIWTGLAKKLEVPIRCVWFKTPLQLCEHNDAVRGLNRALNPEAREVLPRMAFTGFASRYKEPQLKEGFKSVTEVSFAFRGTKEEYAIWGRYWV